MLPHQQKICSDIISKLLDIKNDPHNSYFLAPVDVSQYPDYKTICPKPRDLATIGQNVENNTYDSMNDFAEDVRICFNNGIAFNKNVKERKFVATSAAKMLKVFEKAWQSSIVVKEEMIAKTKVDLGEAQRLLASLKKSKFAPYFGVPVDVNQFVGYELKVPNPMDLSTLENDLSNLSADEFVMCLRRIPANTLRFTAEFPAEEAEFRKQALRFFELVERETSSRFPSVPAVMPEWRQCLKVIERLLKEGYLVSSFLHPVGSYYPNGKPPPDYSKKVPTPMDLGTCLSKLLEGQHRSVADFSSDVLLVFKNCRAYWGNHEDKDAGASILDHCNKLDTLASRELSKLTNQANPPSTASSSSSSSNTIASSNGSTSLVVKPNSKEFRTLKAELEKIMMSMEKYRSPEGYPFAKPFLHPVDLNKYGDYLSVVSEPMDLSKIRRKVEKGSYLDPALLKRDMNVMFSNSKAYNSGESGKDMIIMTNTLEKHFNGIYDEMCQRLSNPHVSSKIPLKETSSSQGKVAVIPTKQPKGGTATAGKVTAASTPPPPVSQSSKPSSSSSSTSSSSSAFTTVPSATAATPSLPPPSSDGTKSEIVTSPPKPRLKLKLKIGGNIKKEETPAAAANTVKEEKAFSPLEKESKAAVKKPSTKSPGIPKKSSAASGRKSADVTNNSMDVDVIDEEEDEDYVEVSSRKNLSSVLANSSGSNMSAAAADISYIGVANSEGSAWVDDALKILGRLMKHEWVNLSKPKGSLYSFAWAVAEQFPGMAEDYLRVIKKPMDLTKVERMLKITLQKGSSAPGSFPSPLAYCEAVIRVFVNAVEYQTGLESSDNVVPLEICYAADHLAKWFTWMVLESPLLQYHIDTSSKAQGVATSSGKEVNGKKPIQLGDRISCQTILHHSIDHEWASFELTIENRDKCRKFREAIVVESTVDERTKECEKILKQLNMTNMKKYSWHFESPIDLVQNPTYSSVISNPTSRKECEDKLNSGKYERMGDLIDELRSIYQNSLVFNAPGETAGNKMAKDICAAARWMQVRLEEKLLVLFLDAAERILRYKVIILIDRAKIRERQSIVDEKNAAVQSILSQQAAAEREEERRSETKLAVAELAKQESLQAITGDIGAVSSTTRNRQERLKIQSGTEQRRLEAIKQEKIAAAEKRMSENSRVRINAVISSFEKARLVANMNDSQPAVSSNTKVGGGSSGGFEDDAMAMKRNLDEAHTPVSIKNFSVTTQSEAKKFKKACATRKQLKAKHSFKASRTISLFSKAIKEKDTEFEVLPLQSEIDADNTDRDAVSGNNMCDEDEIIRKDSIVGIPPVIAAEREFLDLSDYQGFWSENGTVFYYLYQTCDDSLSPQSSLITLSFDHVALNQGRGMDLYQSNEENMFDKNGEISYTASLLGTRPTNPCLAITLLSIQKQAISKQVYENMLLQCRDANSLLGEDKKTTESIGFYSRSNNERNLNKGVIEFGENIKIKLHNSVNTSDGSLSCDNWFKCLPEHVTDFRSRLTLTTEPELVSRQRMHTSNSVISLARHSSSFVSDNEVDFTKINFEQNGIYWPSLGLVSDGSLDQLSFEDTSFNGEAISMLSYPNLCFHLAKKLEKIHHSLSFGMHHSTQACWLRPRKVCYDETLKVWLSCHVTSEEGEEREKVQNEINANKRQKLMTSEPTSFDYVILMRKGSICIEIDGKKLKHPLLG